MQHRGIRAQLVLEDGSRFEGIVRGRQIATQGEVVFTTGMTGYPQYLTDPSFRGQILVSTYPLVGNYGVPTQERDRFGLPRHLESDRIQVQGFVVGEACGRPSHFAGGKTLSDWMEGMGVPLLVGIDTRSLTRHLRSRGTMTGRICLDAEPEGCQDAEATAPGDGERAAAGSVVDRRIVRNPNDEEVRGGGTARARLPASHSVAEVSCKEPVIYDPDPEANLPTVALIDCGAKVNILRCLLGRGVRVIRVPWNHDLEGLEYDGVFLSNGPGDPRACGRTIATVRSLIRQKKPVFGICLGNQILALAAGADTYKLPYGHRGQNQPCIEVGTGRCAITSQNHGYAVRENSIPAGWEVWYTNGNDGTIEGIKSRCGTFSAVQFHPEGCPGPRDTEYLFDRFVAQIGEARA